MDIQQLRDLTKRVLIQADLYSDNALRLLMATAAQESNFKYIRQIGGGPARSFFQVEINTALDHFENYLNFREPLKSRVLKACHLPAFYFREIDPVEDAVRMADILEENIAFAILMARLTYYRSPDPLPDKDNVAGIWGIYKQRYNTIHGAATEHEFRNNLQKYQIMEVV